MGESLWADIDTWQVTLLSGLFMDALAFPTLTAQMVVASLIRHTSEWDNSEMWKFPAIIVAGSRTLRPPSQALFGRGTVSHEKNNLYTWLAVVEGDSLTSVRDAKIYEKRLESAARALILSGWGTGSTYPLQPDQSGERLNTIQLGESNVAVYPRRSDVQVDASYGVAMIDLDFLTING
jgi:hypothetical protein